jgi:hypothetical protein
MVASFVSQARRLKFVQYRERKVGNTRLRARFAVLSPCWKSLPWKMVEDTTNARALSKERPSWKALERIEKGE